jgi:hypothetical protein
MIWSKYRRHFSLATDKLLPKRRFWAWTRERVAWWIETSVLVHYSFNIAPLTHTHTKTHTYTAISSFPCLD